MQEDFNSNDLGNAIIFIFIFQTKLIKNIWNI